MDMAMRSFILAAALALFGAAGLIGWSVFAGGVSLPWAGSDPGPETGYDSSARPLEGSLYDEFGEGAPTSPQPIVIRSGGTTGARPAPGPRFDWSGSPSSGDLTGLSRESPADRVEADCRIRGGSSYGCRCLVRLARRDLDETEFAFLSLAEEAQPRPDRLQAAGLEARDLAPLAGRLVRLDVEARRRCGAGLTP